MRTALLTVIYPEALIYIDDFCECINNQTLKDFDIILINDGCSSVILEQSFKVFNTIILEPQLNPIKNREFGIKYAFRNGYEYLIFCDIDDYFAPNRFQTIIDNFLGVDIVVHDLNIVDENRKSLCNNYFSYSINCVTLIDSEFIKEKNMLGLSNTAIRLQHKAIVDFPENIKIGDWYYFTVCLNRGLKVKYIPESLTDYRQHSNNLIGIDDFSLELFKKLVRLKVEHYQFIYAIYPEYATYLNDTMSLLNYDDNAILTIIENNKKRNPHPLWWENIKKHN